MISNMMVYTAAKRFYNNNGCIFCNKEVVNFVRQNPYSWAAVTGPMYRINEVENFTKQNYTNEESFYLFDTNLPCDAVSFEILNAFMEGINIECKGNLKRRNSILNTLWELNVNFCKILPGLLFCNPKNIRELISFDTLITEPSIIKKYMLLTQSQAYALIPILIRDCAAPNTVSVWTNFISESIILANKKRRLLV